MTKSSDIQISHLKNFLDALWLESGLSDNTVTAYQHDLIAFAGWLQPFDVALAAAESEHIQRYLQQRMRDGKKVRSDARLLSSLRRFYRYLCREGIRDSDPTAMLESPRLGKSLPASLSEEDVDKLLAQPDTESALGMRDRTMLEVLY